MTLLKREAILSAEDLPYEDLEVPEWGGTVRVRTLTGTQRDAWEARLAPDKEGAKPNLENVRASFAVAVLVDETGQSMFTPADINKLGMKSAKPLDRIFDVGRRLSGLGDKDVEKLAGNFDDAPTEPSSSDSPPTSD